ncbi:MAG: radical SAM family heme chaperone HemW [Gemmatimonadetes bacterium]|nr:radical SAM family heme chaperone HemW [Gemmatimonadota bacterium]
MAPQAARVRSVYVHAPFCVRRCVYCDFAVTVRSTGDVDGWAQALAAELALLDPADGLLADRLETVYVGGGTPSLLGPTAMRALARVLGEDRLSAADLEWTAEANPESFTPELGSAWRDAGVNRLSLGVQSFHEPTLRWMGRMHGAEGAVRAVRDAKVVGLTNASVDLVFGLPASLGRPWTDDLERALDLDVPHVSLYGLSVEPGTPLGRAVAEGKEPAVDDERYRDEFLEAADRLVRAGYEHYEVSNFARPGYVSRHNAVYWDGRPYLGLGNGAHSYLHPVRRWNVRDWGAYAQRALGGQSPEEGRERIDAAAESLERTWLALRTREGLGLGGLTEDARILASRWAGAGLARVTGDSVRLTTEGWLLLDRLAVELDSLSAVPVGSAAG